MSKRDYINVWSRLLLLPILSSLCEHVELVVPDCTPREATLTCTHGVPPELPNGVQEVYVKNYADNVSISIPNTTNWKRITKLDIAFGGYGRANGVLQDNTFKHLSRLQTLGLHGHPVYLLMPDSLLGLSKVEHLNLSGCGSLSMNNLLPSLENASFRNLSTLNLHRLHSNNGKCLEFRQDFLEFLAKASIVNIDLSNTVVNFSTLSWPQERLKVEVVDASNIAIISGVVTSWMNVVILLSNVKVFNYSDIAVKYNVVSFHRNNTVFNVYQRFGVFWRMERLYVNNDVSQHGPNYLNNVTVNVFGKWDLKIFHARGINIINLDATLNAPNNTLQDVDISNNHLKYISPAFFGDLKKLKILLLASNSLHNMQWDNEFELLIASCEQLEKLSLAQNRLSNIPQNMFQNNWKLRDLNMSYNWLETIHFNLKMLVHLERLDLNGNKIKQLDTNSIIQLSYVLDSFGQNKIKITPVIDLGNNPFVCSCDSVKSVQWLVRHLISAATERYRCTLEDKTVEIDQKAMDHLEYLCKRTTIVIVSTITSCLTVCIIVMVIIGIVRKIKKNRQLNIREQFLRNFIEGNLKFGDHVVKHLAFIAFCGDDEGLAVDYIYTEMDQIFRGVLQDDRDTIAYGNKNFHPGFPIVTEMMQCLSESCVAIFVISHSFCQSNWCQTEIKEAYAQQKPILLIFTDYIEEGLMSSFLLNIYRRYTRAKITKIGDQYILEPTWEVFCDSVITLASIEAEKKLNRNKIAP